MSVIFWLFWFSIRKSKNGNSLKLFSMLNFLRFSIKLYKSLMLPDEYLHNMKQSSRFLFHDLINLFLILSCDFI